MSRKPERMTNGELLGLALILVQKVQDDIEESQDPIDCVAMGRLQVVLWAIEETRELLE